MQRVLIIGPSGAGKSTLANTLGARLGLPVIHIDRLNWNPGWVESERPDLADKVAAAAADERWLIDGNYGDTLVERLARADTVVYLDFPIPLCFWRILRRWWTYRGRTRPDMTEHCPERLDPAFLRYVMRWKSGPGRQTEALLSGYAGRLVRLRGPCDVAQWVNSLD